MFRRGASLANPSGNHQIQHVWSSSMNPTSGEIVNYENSSNQAIPGSALGLKFNLNVSLRWMPVEQAILKQGLARFASESLLSQYTKIANQLKYKTVRDVALRVRWMNRKAIGRRRKDEHSLTRKRKDIKEGVSDPSVKSSRYAPPSNCGITYEEIIGRADDLLAQDEQAFNRFFTNLAASLARVSVPSAESSHYAPPSSCGISYEEIVGRADDLLAQDAQAFSRFFTNLLASLGEENISLVHQIRDNVIKITNDFDF